MDYKLRRYHQHLDTTLQEHADSSVPGIIEQTRLQQSGIMDMILLQHVAGGFRSIYHTLGCTCPRSTTIPRRYLIWATPRYILNFSAPKLCPLYTANRCPFRQHQERNCCSRIAFSVWIIVNLSPVKLLFKEGKETFVGLSSFLITE